MDKQDIILAAFAAAKRAVFTPVQVQKLLFLIDMKIPEQVGGPFFEFVPYDYGPFDKDVYQQLEELAKNELVEILPCPGLSWNKYQLTVEGQERGEEVLSELAPEVADYLRSLSQFVRSLSFAELVSSIYRAYPDMRVNSVFRN